MNNQGVKTVCSVGLSDGQIVRDSGGSSKKKGEMQHVSQEYQRVELPAVGDIILYNEVIKSKNSGCCPHGFRGVGRVVEKTARLCVVERMVSESVRYLESIQLTDFVNGLVVFRKLEDIHYCAGVSYEDLSVDSEYFEEFNVCAS